MKLRPGALRTTLTAAFTACLLAAWAAPAQAVDTLEYDVDGGPFFADDGGEGSTLTITATRTSITFAQGGDDAIDVVDDAPECTGDGTATVTCTSTEFTRFTAFLGDGNDTVTANGELGGGLIGDAGVDTLTGSDTNGRFEFLSGGADNDQLNSRNVGPALPLPDGLGVDGIFDPTVVGDSVEGSSGNDTVVSGNGNDYLNGDGSDTPLALASSFATDRSQQARDGGTDGNGETGTDVVVAGAGNDNAFGGPGNGDQVSLGEGDDFSEEESNDGSGDVVDGGPGVDAVEFDSETAIIATTDGGSDGPPEPPPVNFDVNLATGAATPGPDTAVNFEDTFTDDGNDVVTGNDASNEIGTWTGNDTVNPGGGADSVDLDPFQGSIDGADGTPPPAFGNDIADLRDGFGDRVQCGGGVDTIAADQFDQVGSDCENVSRTETRAGGADVLAPDCTLSKVKGSYSRNAFFRGFNVAVACNEGGTLIIQLLAAFNNKLFSAGAGDVVLAEKRVNLTGANTSTKIKPLKKFKRRLRKKGFRARVNLEAVDQYGNRSIERKALKVKKTKAKTKKRKRR